MNNNSVLLPKNTQQIFVNGPVGVLDTLKMLPKTEIRGIALIFHPDPKGGGTYTNKVVQSIAKVMNAKGYISFCPNLRGVGLSEGEHDYGRGEIADGLAVYKYAVDNYPGLPVVLAGFSFGTAISSNVASQVAYQKLILVGPAVTRYEVVVPEWDKVLVIHGQDDEIIPLEDVYVWAHKYNVPISVFAKTGHFFHGKLIQLQSYLTQNLT